MPRTLFIAGVLLGALAIAGVPVLGLRWLIDATATHQADKQLEAAAQRISSHIDGLLSEASDVLAEASGLAHGSCGSEDRARLSSIAFEARSLKNVLILGNDGHTLCSSSEIPNGIMLGLHFRPTRQKNLSVGVSPTSEGGRALINVRAIDGERMIIASLVLDLQRLDLTPVEWKSRANGAIAFDDGTIIAALPSPADIGKSSSKSEAGILSTKAASERFPIQIQLSVPAEVVLESSRLLITVINLGGGVLGLLFFLLVAQTIWRKPSVEDAIARGIRRNQFIPFYQPVFDIQKGELVGCEVLIRWRKEDGSIVPPGAFIREAEESGQAVEMTRQLMKKVRDELGEAYAARSELKLAINLFADHFSDFTTVDDVREIFSAGGVRYQQLVFEVTERYPLPNLARAKLAIKGLQDLGCRVALDDAGTGHGGLAYLQTLGMDQIKIDKLFVDTITAYSAASPIIDSLIELGRSLKMEIVAEGVETREQVQYLRQRGVQFAQGYLFAKPLPGASYIEMIQAKVAAEAHSFADFPEEGAVAAFAA